MESTVYGIVRYRWFWKHSGINANTSIGQTFIQGQIHCTRDCSLFVLEISCRCTNVDRLNFKEMVLLVIREKVIQFPHLIFHVLYFTFLYTFTVADFSISMCSISRSAGIVL